MGKVSDSGKRVALVVGVDHYEDDQFNDLTCAVSDAARVCGFLERVARYDRVELLASHVTAEAVLQAVKTVAKPLGPGDLFVFYFAGHGAEHEGRHILLCPQAEYLGLRYHHGCVPVDYVREVTDECGPDRVFILDACRTDLLRARGQGSTGLRGEAGLRDVVARAQVRRGAFALLCSCSEGEQARELPGLRHGLFTAALLRVLEAGVASGTEVAVSDGLRLSLAQEMGRLCEECGWAERQKPWHLTAGSTTPTLIFGMVRQVEAPVAHETQAALACQLRFGHPLSQIIPPPPNAIRTAPTDVGTFLDQLEEMYRVELSGTLDELERSQYAKLVATLSELEHLYKENRSDNHA